MDKKKPLKCPAVPGCSAPLWRQFWRGGGSELSGLRTDSCHWGSGRHSEISSVQSQGNNRGEGRKAYKWEAEREREASYLVLGAALRGGVWGPRVSRAEGVSQGSGRRHRGVWAQRPSTVVSWPAVSVLRLPGERGGGGGGGGPHLGAGRGVCEDTAALLVDKESVHPEVEQLAVGTHEILRPGNTTLFELLWSYGGTTHFWNTSISFIFWENSILMSPTMRSGVGRSMLMRPSFLLTWYTSDMKGRTEVCRTSNWKQIFSEIVGKLLEYFKCSHWKVTTNKLSPRKTNIFMFWPSPFTGS